MFDKPRHPSDDINTQAVLSHIVLYCTTKAAAHVSLLTE